MPESFVEKGYYIQYLDDDTFEDFEKIIKEEIVEICCGYCNCDINDVPEIAELFLQRVEKEDSKDGRHKVGYIGELLYYVFAKYKFPFLTSINPMLNMEEKSFKKGFDMISTNDYTIWYSEVKSGAISFSITPVLNKTNLKKLSAAYSDLTEKLDGENKNKNYWITAKNKLRLCIEEESDVKRLSKILDSDMKVSKVKNKIIVSVIFGKTKEQIDEKKVNRKLQKLREKDENLIIVCIRENTIERTIKVIKGMCCNE